MDSADTTVDDRPIVVGVDVLAARAATLLDAELAEIALAHPGLPVERSVVADTPLRRCSLPPTGHACSWSAIGATAPGRESASARQAWRSSSSSRVRSW